MGLSRFSRSRPSYLGISCQSFYEMPGNSRPLTGRLSKDKLAVASDSSMVDLLLSKAISKVVIACESAKELEGRIVATTGGCCLLDEDAGDYGSPLFLKIK